MGSELHETSRRRASCQVTAGEIRIHQDRTFLVVGLEIKIPYQPGMAGKVRHQMFERDDIGGGGSRKSLAKLLAIEGELGPIQW